MRTALTTLIFVALLTALLVVSSPGMAHLAGTPGTGGPYEEPADSDSFVVPRVTVCDNHRADWRNATTVYGVEIEESRQCEPDNPKLVAASVVGTNNVPQEDLDAMSLHEDAVVKGRDLDGDGDPDEINITLEVTELNGWHMQSDVLGGEGFPIAPGIKPALWAFTPKTSINHAGESFFDLARAPSVPIRVEVNDTVRITLENTHYFPHTIHLHGTDHPARDADGEGNDGVPHFIEKPVLPGEKRTYELTPRVPGTNFYHCHVQPHVHVAMGLGTIIIVEENRANNTLQTLNLGGGHVRAPSQAVREEYHREYDMVYQDYDKELGEIVQSSNDPRVVAERQNRIYDVTDRDMDYYLLNGRSFPYTLLESQVVVAPDELVKLRVINAGANTLSLHTHGHKATITNVDGVPLASPVQRDVYTLTAAQRVDLALNTTDDGLNNYGAGVWFTHDHREEGVTTDGIGPGGDITTITYESWLDNETSMPITEAPLSIFFSEAYYRGEIPVWTGLGHDTFLGQVARESQDEGDGPASQEPGALVPAPGALVALSLVGAALILASRREVVR